MNAPSDFESGSAPRRSKTAWWMWALVGVCGCCGIAIVAVLIPAARVLRVSSGVQKSLVHIRDLNNGLSMYAADNHDTFPPAKSWQDAAESRMARGVSRGRGASFARTEFAFHTKYGGVVRAKVSAPSTRIVLFDTNLGVRNANGGFESIPAGGRLNGRIMLGFVDGHVAVIRTRQLEKALNQDR